MSATDLLREVFTHIPDPNEPLPISNRKATIYGAVIPFLTISWVAIALRMWVRIRIMRDVGWDDYFVVFAACLNTTASALVLTSVNYGLGRHYIFLSSYKMVKYQSFFYAENAVYVTETAIIKISLLLQYLRIFRAGRMRWTCIVLLVIISLWGLAYSILAWVPCMPVPAFWNRLKYPNAKCWGFGFADIDDFVALFESHTATNMMFDVVVFVTPMILFKNPNLKKKNIFAIVSIFLLGGVVVFTSVWRLYAIVNTRAATKPYIDFTWWAPVPILLSCLEIALAIICASMPVFWPVLNKSISAIFVTHEVQITEHRRLDDGETDETFELGHATSLNGQGSLKSGHSREELNRAVPAGQAGYYKDIFVASQVVPMDAERGLGQIGLETNVNSKKPPNWNL